MVDVSWISLSLLVRLIIGRIRFSIWLKLRVVDYWEISVSQLFEFSLSLLVDITSGWPLGDFRVSIGWHYEWLTIGRFPCLNCLSFPCLYWLTSRVVDIGSFPCLNCLSFPSLYWLTLWVVNHWGISVSLFGWNYEWLPIGRFPCLYWLTLRLVDHWEISVSLLVEFSVSLFVEFSVSLLAEITSGFPLGYFRVSVGWHYEVYYWEISVPQLFEFSLSLLVDITSGWSLEVFHVSIVWVFHLSIGWHYEQWPIGRFPCHYWLTLRVVAHWETSMSLLVDITSGWPLKVFRVSIVWVFHVSIDWHYEWLTTADLRRPKLLFCVSFAWSFLTSWLFHFCVICTRPKSLYS